MSTEIELKLATTKTGLNQAMKLPWLKKKASEGRKKTPTSVYFDTDIFALRNKVGAQRLQTIKADSSAIMARNEWETEIDRDQPKRELARGTALAPLLTSEQQNSSNH